MRILPARPFRPLWLAALLLILCSVFASAADPWITFQGKEGPGKGKHIVLVSGDEEYRSEEGLPQLAKILADRHGFACTVLFSIDPKTGKINPDEHNNIPGLEALDSADLMIILTRFRSLPDDQMKHIDQFLMAGKPVIGLRTATHAFNDLKGEYAKYNYNYHGKDDEAWKDGFGRLVLGETWISHHGAHKSQSTRGIIAPDAKDSPLLNGIQSGEIWVPTDVYGVRLPLPGDSKPIILGQVTKRNGPAKDAKDDPFYGMRPTDTEPAGPETDKKGQTVEKNNPMMPVAWTKSYQLPGGKPGHAFCTTMGSSLDLTNEPLRRLIVNAVYDLLGMPVPQKANVEIVGDYKPSTFGFKAYKKDQSPEDYAK